MIEVVVATEMAEPIVDTAPPCGQPSQCSEISDITDNSTEDYCATGGHFYERMKYWMGSFYRLYHVQHAIIFKAGETINTNKLDKDGARFTEIATKYKEVSEHMRLNNLITASELEQLKTLKYQQKSDKGTDSVVEVFIEQG